MEEMFSKICFCHFWQKEVHKIRVSEPEPPGAASFRVEPEPIFYLAGAAFFKAVPAASFWQAKKESLVLLQNITLKQFIMVNVIQKRLTLIIHF